MKRVLILCLTVLCAGFAVAQTPEMGAPKEMELMKELSGEWDVTYNVKAMPEAPWTEVKASAVCTMMLDGATQMMEFRGNVMGSPMKGISLTSFNRSTQMWQNVWVDNMSATISMFEGPMKDGVIVMEGEDMMGGMKMAMRITQSNMSADGYDWKMEVSMDGGNEYFEMANAKFTRKKASDNADDGGW